MNTKREVAKIVTILVVLLLLVLGGRAGTVDAPPTPKAFWKDSSILTTLPWLDSQRFQYHVQTQLPVYEVHFKDVADKYRVPWTLLASQAYQESRWNRNAVSPTGVRGLMMLTKNTASALGVTDRLDPIQSIEGGARYFATLERQLPQRIPHPDRTWIALAAYNIGMGHIQDAQELAKRFNKDPHSWADLETVLPLLSQKEYYKTLQHGYARGNEPVHYVKRIRAYWNLLEKELGEV